MEFFKKGFKSLKFKKSRPSPFGELEEKVMDYLWKHGSGTVKEVRSGLGENRFAHTTVMTVMDRLYKKGILRRKKEGKGYRYYPVMTRDEFESQVAKKVITDILKNNPSSAVAAFEGVIEELGEEEIRKLKEIIERRFGDENGK
ncbi:BlaI/MecI/CopY family transcriptional regulator [Persephonella sp.]